MPVNLPRSNGCSNGVGCIISTALRETQMTASDAFSKIYRVQWPPMYWVLVLGTPLFFVVFGSVWLWIGFQQGGQSTLVTGAWFVMWLGLCAWASVRYMTMPHTIEVSDGTIRFVGAFRTHVIASSTVVSRRRCRSCVPISTPASRRTQGPGV